ncbi:MAG TPA: hypothetical protein VMW65_06085, partial [Chloroflexota bacterium]|nr:hypothetical protein [Chloroflexota bacterium]
MQCSLLIERRREHATRLDEKTLRDFVLLALDGIVQCTQQSVDIDTSLHEVILGSLADGGHGDLSTGQAAQHHYRHGGGLVRHPAKAVEPVAVRQHE